jgi:hypothetical protein
MQELDNSHFQDTFSASAQAIKLNGACACEIAIAKMMARVSEWDRSYRYRGLCGWFQCGIGYLLQDMGFSPHAFAIQSIGDVYEHDHVALTLKTDSGVYLIDPSFVQFADSGPIRFLFQSELGANLFNDLKNQGYTELTPEKSCLYLRAIYGEKCPIQDDAAAYQFMTSGGHSKYNWVFGREDMGLLRIDKIPPSDTGVVPVLARA